MPAFPVLILCKDLFFGSQLHAAVQRAGLTSRTCLSQAACLEQIVTVGTRCVVADVELPDLDLPALKAALGDDGRLVAFGPHVHADLLSAARQAGCDLVCTRGQTAAALERLLSKTP